LDEEEEEEEKEEEERKRPFDDKRERISRFFNRT
tara:strand:- start:657 stop:758 length:102 start_codon:yes stop_codon:yes gene_type:complete